MQYKSRQEIFDTAYTGLKAQGFEQSLAENSEFSCLYRGVGGLKCAIGHCIPDELYSPRLESKTADMWDVREAAGVSLQDYLFARKLQHVHDSSYTPEVMEKKLEKFAKEWELKVPE